MLVIRQNPINGDVNCRDLDITQEQVDAYDAGAMLQNAFSNLSADDREFYKTGIDNWDEMFAEAEQMAKYNKEAIDKEIKKDPKIKAKQYELIHRLLKGRSK